MFPCQPIAETLDRLSLKRGVQIKRRGKGKARVEPGGGREEGGSVHYRVGRREQQEPEMGD